MNREQRRAAKRQGLLDEHDETMGMSLKEYLSEPDKMARRGEVAAVAERVYVYKEWQKRRNRWYNRLLRRIRMFFEKHFHLTPGPDDLPEEGSPGEEDDG